MVEEQGITGMPENQNIEYKSSWHDDWLKWICGFANANGGKLYLGKDDKGNVTGISDYKKLMDDLPNKIRNYLGIAEEVNLFAEGNKNFIEIMQSDAAKCQRKAVIF